MALADLSWSCRCTDSQYLQCASSASQCVRMSMWYWECLPNVFQGPDVPPGVPLPTLNPPSLPTSATGGRRLAEDTQPQVAVVLLHNEEKTKWP